jgi:hypothetical protein
LDSAWCAGRRSLPRSKKQKQDFTTEGTEFAERKAEDAALKGRRSLSLVAMLMGAGVDFGAACVQDTLGVLHR